MIWLLIVPCSALVVFGCYIVGYGVCRAFTKECEL